MQQIPLLEKTFKKPLDEATTQTLSALRNPSSLNATRRMVKQWNALRDFRDRLDDIDQGRASVQQVSSVRSIGGRQYHILEEGQWRGYFTEIGNPPILTGILFVDSSTKSLQEIAKQLASI